MITTHIFKAFFRLTLSPLTNVESFSDGLSRRTFGVPRSAWRIPVFFSVLLLTATLSLCAAEESDDAKSLDGVWKPLKAELAGQPMAEAIIKTITLKLDHSRYEVTADGNPRPDIGTVTLNTSFHPKSMKIVGVKGTNAGKMFPAIYELEGDTLRICYDLSGEKTPTEFKTRPGTKLYLVTYHRAAAPSR